jgi:hypothetical protein
MAAVAQAIQTVIMSRTAGNPIDAECVVNWKVEGPPPEVDSRPAFSRAAVPPLLKQLRGKRDSSLCFGMTKRNGALARAV